MGLGWPPRPFGAMLIVVATVFGTGAAAEEPDMVNFAFGSSNVGDQDRASAIQGEFRSGYDMWGISPFVGFMRFGDGAFYGYFGLGMEIELGGGFILTPNLAAGYYTASSGGDDLGHPMEFRSGGEIAYQLESGGRVGLAFHHISNASIGDRNPGTELLRISYSFPLNFGGGDDRDGPLASAARR